MNKSRVSLACIFLAISFLPALITPGVMASECPGLKDVKRLRFTVFVLGDMGISAQKIRDVATKAIRRKLPHLQIDESTLKCPVFRITIIGATHETRTGIRLESGSLSLKMELIWMAKAMPLKEGSSNSLNYNLDECSSIPGILWEGPPHLMTGTITEMKEMLQPLIENNIEKFAAEFHILDFNF